MAESLEYSNCNSFNSLKPNKILVNIGLGNDFMPDHSNKSLPEPMMNYCE